MNILWRDNTPAQFWQCQPDPSPDTWHTAIDRARAILNLPPGSGSGAGADDLNDLLSQVLGEGQFGPDHWTLSRCKRLYYQIKHLIPRRITRVMRQVYSNGVRSTFPLDWPVEARYARFQWALMRQVLQTTDLSSVTYRHFWPQGKRFAFVLTHDIETAQGQAFVPIIVDLEERYGFRSSFNVVPERYPVDRALLADLHARGFEIGVHGLNHDGTLFSSYQTFQQRVDRINHYLAEWGATGFRSPYTMRNPAWQQALNIDYDSSFFDTDPFEPVAGGTMSIWPFMLGAFVELPYTLVQDYSLARVLKETTARIWIEKVDFIRDYHGMALLNTHPDYLRDDTILNLYTEFLAHMQHTPEYWHALPRDVAQWWRTRLDHPRSRDVTTGQIMLTETGIRLC